MVLLECVLDSLPPTVNHMYRTNYYSKVRHKTPEGKAWQDAAIEVIRQAKQAKGKVYTGDVKLSLIFCTKDKRRWDIDNRVKAVQDCLADAGVIKDDCQIQMLNVSRLKSDATETVLRVYTLGSKDAWEDEK